jgi:acetolactate synthase-1/3 small subunit
MAAPAATNQQHTITALVQNESGTINRVVSLFRRRGFSLASFNAGDCEQPGFSRMTFVVNGDNAVLKQVLLQLEKLIDIVECEDLSPEEGVHREMALVRCQPSESQRSDLDKLVSEFMAKTPKANDKNVVVEFTGEVEEVERLIEALTPFNVSEIVRTGLVAMKVSA